MKKYETLKAIVILQAVSMVALAGFVIWYYWPQANDDEVKSLTHDQSKANAEDEVVAIIADQNITKQQLVDELLLLYGDHTLKNMLEHYAIQIASKEHNIVVTEEEIQEELALRAQHYHSIDEYVKVMTEQVGILPERLYQDVEDELLLIKIATKDIIITDDEVVAYMLDNPDEYVTRYALAIDWILVEEKQLADQILSSLEKGKPFATLASTYSIDEYTAANGGNMGFIDEDDTIYPEILRETALALEVGSIAGPLAINESFAIIRLAEKRAIKHITEEQRIQLIRNDLALERADALDDVLEGLINQYGSLIKKQKL